MSEVPLQTVDPDGDFYINVGETILAAQREHDDSVAAEAAANTEQNPPIDPDEEKYQEKGRSAYEFKPTDKSLRILVCTNVMALASPFFTTQLNGEWKDAKKNVLRDNESRFEVCYPEDDPSAMLLLCRILHHKEEVGHMYNYRELHNLAVLVHKYGCFESVRLWFSSQWQHRLPPVIGDFAYDFPKFTDVVALQIVRLAYHLGDRKWFAYASKIFAYTGDVKDMGSSFPRSGIIDEMELPMRLTAALFVLQQRLLRTFETIPGRALKDVLYYADDVQHNPSGVWPMRRTLCDGLTWQYGHAANIIAREDLFPIELMSRTVQKRVKLIWGNMDKCTLPSEKIHKAVCDKIGCLDCKSSLGNDMNCHAIEKMMKNQLREDYTDFLRKDEICLDCVKDKRPFEELTVGYCYEHGASGLQMINEECEEKDLARRFGRKS